MKILLHACCGPCSLEPVRLLAEEGHSLTIAYMNSNIQPEGEYRRRLETLLDWARGEGIPVVEGRYDVQRWRDSAGRVETGGGRREDRCRACYRLRLEEAAAWAARHGFEGLGTTLTVSPYQYTRIIGEELERCCAPYGLAPVFRDFRPFYPEATKRSRNLGMYRQNYCGCLYSAEESRLEREQRREQRRAEAARRAAERAPLEAQREAERRARIEERARYDRKQRAKREMRDKLRAQARAEAAGESAVGQETHPR